jgi:hypothetical protein
MSCLPAQRPEQISDAPWGSAEKLAKLAKLEELAARAEAPRLSAANVESAMAQVLFASKTLMRLGAVVAPRA